MSVTVNELTKRVKRGAHFMDGKMKGWALDIDLPKLTMSDGRSCILGQCYGDYDTAAAEFGLARWIEKTNELKDAKSVYRGFTLDDKEDKPKNWSALTELWAIEVAVRQVRAAK